MIFIQRTLCVFQHKPAPFLVSKNSQDKSLHSYDQHFVFIRRLSLDTFEIHTSAFFPSNHVINIQYTTAAHV